LVGEKSRTELKMWSKSGLRFLPQLFLTLFCLFLYLMFYPPVSLIVLISEAFFYIVGGFFVSQAMIHGAEKVIKRQNVITLVLIPSFAIILFANQNFELNLSSKVKREKYLVVMKNIVSMSMVHLVLHWLRLFNNKTENRKILKKSKHHLGPGLARSFFSFLEMLTNRDHGTPGLEDLLGKYGSNDDIKLHPKVFILFPRNTSQDAGSHSWMFKKEREYNEPRHLEKHGPVQFTFQGTITREYFLNGKKRDIDLAVLKIRNTETMKVYYAVIAENRGLITLQKMIKSHSLKPPFLEEDFQLQSQIYKNNLDTLIQEDEACRDIFELVDMQDDCNGDFTVKIYNSVREDGDRKVGNGTLGLSGLLRL